MKHRLGQAVLFLIFAVLAALTGCGRSDGPPPALPVEQIPAALQKAFAKATPETKEVVQKLNAALLEKDYPAAYAGIQILSKLTEATKEQRTATVRSLLTLNQLLQEAQAKGDSKAAAVIQYNKKNR